MHWKAKFCIGEKLYSKCCKTSTTDKILDNVCKLQSLVTLQPIDKLSAWNWNKMSIYPEFELSNYSLSGPYKLVLKTKI